MTSKSLHPFLKWAGGKRQLLPVLRTLTPASFNTYYEPFLGGGAFFFDLKPQNAVLCDINKSLINAYKCIKEQPAELLRLIEKLDAVPCDKNYYTERRADYNMLLQNGTYNLIAASLFIWLNKHCFNGLYRVNSKGLFNVPFNNSNSKSIDKDNVLAISDYLNTADIVLSEGSCFNLEPLMQQNDFAYFDPPYDILSDTANFTQYTKTGFSKDDQKALSDMFRRLDARNVYCMLSNNDTPFIRDLYKGYNIKNIDVQRAINRDKTKRRSTEIIITNY